MNTNIGDSDRTARLIVGVALLALGSAGAAGLVGVGLTVAAVAGLVGAVLVGTALTRFCLLYRVIGVDTCSAR